MHGPPHHVHQSGPKMKYNQLSPEAKQAIEEFKRNMREAKEREFTYVGGSLDGKVVTYLSANEGFSVAYKGELYHRRGSKLVFERRYK